MKKIVYVIIVALALVFLVNLSAISENSNLKLDSNGEILEFNPLY